MHPEVVDNESGLCPICQMNLVPLRLDLVWTCPIHLDLVATEAGRCRRCGRDLIRVIKALSWTCRVHRQIDELNPGACRICRRPLVAKYTDRPHGDHNPKHGGLFFMAPNDWHIEVTHPRAGLFRLYVYDEYSKPFLPRAFTGRIVEAAPALATTRSAELAVPFRRLGAQPFLEARVPKLAVPASVAVKIRFGPNDQEYRFDFTFTSFSKEPDAGSQRSQSSQVLGVLNPDWSDHSLA